MRPLHLREWPIFHTLLRLGQGTAADVLQALSREQVADRHSVRATLQTLAAEGYLHAERTTETDGDGQRLERVTYTPAVTPEEALRTAWPELREVVLDGGRYLPFFRELVERED